MPYNRLAPRPRIASPHLWEILDSPLEVHLFSLIISGRRMCLGEQMAKVEIFLVVSNLLQQFTFKFPEHDAIPAQDDVVDNIFCSHKPFRVCAVPRS